MIEFRKDLFADERDDNLNEVGKPTQRQDMVGHVTGRSPYFDDHLFEGLLHLKCLRSPHHHARIRSIEIGEAERSPGVRRVILAKDVPNNLNTLLSLMNFGRDDEPLISGTKVAYKGEPVAAVVADSERACWDAIAKIRVSWEVLPHVLDPEEALKPGAPIVNDAYPGNAFTYHETYDHQKLRFGDVEAAFRQADQVIEGRYQMSPIEQAPTETCGAIAAPETNDRFVVYTSTQALFFSLGTAAKLLNLPTNRLHFIGGTVGGGFGGKVDSLHEPMAVLGCMLTGRPVKYTFDREEEMQVGAPRGAERWYVQDGVMRDGRLVARKLTGYFDAGAYTRLSSYAIIKSVGHLPGPYTIPNVYADVYCVFTNRTPATAMRGFGVTGVDFAIESHMDRVAYEIGMDPIEYRLRNAYRDGDMKAHRRVAKNTALVECCQVVAEKAHWPIGAEYKRMTSLEGGGGERGAIPAHTATDRNGTVGQGRPAARPGPAPRPTGPAPMPAPRQAPSYSPEPAMAARPYADSPNTLPGFAPSQWSTSQQPMPGQGASAPSRTPPPQGAPSAPPPREPARPAPNRFSSSVSGLRRR